MENYIVERKRVEEEAKNKGKFVGGFKKKKTLLVTENIEGAGEKNETHEDILLMDLLQNFRKLLKTKKEVKNPLKNFLKKEGSVLSQDLENKGIFKLFKLDKVKENKIEDPITQILKVQMSVRLLLLLYINIYLEK